jgi:adenine-specific DNA-methyltransferase
MNRRKDFEAIKAALSDSLQLSAQDRLLAEGDSLELLKLLPDHCVSLVLTDPPYHSTKKKNIYGDKLFREDSQYVEWLSEYAKEWFRVLKPSGSLFCFCASALSAKLEVAFSQKFNILNQVVWAKPNDPGFDGWKQKMKKEALRQWYPHSERIIFAEPACDGNLFRSYFGQELFKMRKKAGFSMHELTAKTGAHGRVNHGGAVSNWEAGRNIPSKEQYDKIRDALFESGKIDEMPLYEDIIRPFKTNGSDQFTDVWNFPSVRPYENKHPAEKPISLLQHAIRSTTYDGDIVLDCFSGSGNTAIAALNLGRLPVAIEIEPKWVAISKNKLKYRIKHLEEFVRNQ